MSTMTLEHPPVSEAERREVTDFIYREARLADEARYADWEALWTDDGVYWVPRAEGHDPARQVSHIYDNRTRIATRVRQLATGYRYSQEPASPMRRLLSNVEITRTDDGYEVGSNFVLTEIVAQSTHELRVWAGRSTHRLRRVEGGLKMAFKKVVLVNGDEAVPTLAFLI
ncbi:aromatic-ring-hydroxylating dioxygenase subunit beta [Immundisolibacter sp.]|uniref:aromatic-ring-hydroxylating dioxygenase subunit beta n=1 Tax=Immundisolibacter sp. TaxID=1934948 RepID=UPI00262494BD|nr:aromatic-ring-hydroxylating dioxygenase subunit beta [Immundisolibacter sp.]MDD3649851.1 aromatic-ring-hydroxylating dioxygenase subunit beta [Immundisolibacter sp.]